MLINEKYVKLLLSTLYKVFACHYITNSANLSDINLFQVNESSPRQNMSNITAIRLESIHMESIEVLQRENVTRLLVTLKLKIDEETEINIS